MLALDAAAVCYSLHAYEPGDHVTDVGRRAAAALGLDPDAVFKTLVVVADGALVIAAVPVSSRLSTKRVAAAVGAKRAELCEPGEAERVTGYVVGGISPFGQRRRLPTVVDETVRSLETVYVSGGRRGLDVGVAPDDLLRLTGAHVAAITD